jgi:ABC-type xylose transport system permease subunit
MKVLLRRFLVLMGLLFWQGGFLFYVSVVVPIGQQELGASAQGFLTRQVTQIMNLAGVVALVPLTWDVAASREASSLRRGLRAAACLALLLSLVALFALHARLDQLLDLDQYRVLDRARFRSGHRWYLWISTVQWLCSLVYLGLALPAWREEDRRT